jgi:haloalkane dehalogenase
VSWVGPNAPDPALFGPLRGADGERLVLAENDFVEKVLPTGTLRRLTTDEMDAYRAPYREPGESRRPTLTGRARSRSTASRPTSTSLHGDGLGQ